MSLFPQLLEILEKNVLRLNEGFWRVEVGCSTMKDSFIHSFSFIEWIDRTQANTWR